MQATIKAHQEENNTLNIAERGCVCGGGGDRVVLFIDSTLKFPKEITVRVI